MIPRVVNPMTVATVTRSAVSGAGSIPGDGILDFDQRGFALPVANPRHVEQEFIRTLLVGRAHPCRPCAPEPLHRRLSTLRNVQTLCPKKRAAIADPALHLARCIERPGATIGKHIGRANTDIAPASLHHLPGRIQPLLKRTGTLATCRIPVLALLLRERAATILQIPAVLPQLLLRPIDGFPTMFAYRRTRPAALIPQLASRLLALHARTLRRLSRLFPRCGFGTLGLLAQLPRCLFTLPRQTLLLLASTILRLPAQAFLLLPGALSGLAALFANGILGPLALLARRIPLPIVGIARRLPGTLSGVAHAVHPRLRGDIPNQRSQQRKCKKRQSPLLPQTMVHIHLPAQDPPASCATPEAPP